MAAVAHAVLIAGVGNVLKGDDGFGVEVACRLQESNLPPGVRVIETGIGGMTLVQELMDGYRGLIVLDAYRNGGEPGRLYLLEPVLPDLSTLDPHELRDYFCDTHYATPMRALSLLGQVASVPAVVRIIGCEPQALDRFEIGLSAAVAAAVGPAADMALEVATEIVGAAAPAPGA